MHIASKLGSNSPFFCRNSPLVFTSPRPAGQGFQPLPEPPRLPPCIRSAFFASCVACRVHALCMHSHWSASVLQYIHSALHRPLCVAPTLNASTHRAGWPRFDPCPKPRGFRRSARPAPATRHDSRCQSQLVHPELRKTGHCVARVFRYSTKVRKS